MKFENIACYVPFLILISVFFLKNRGLDGKKMSSPRIETQVPHIQDFLVGYFFKMGISFTNGLDLGKNFEIKILKYFSNR